jgi:serine/threonine-protein kinase
VSHPGIAQVYDYGEDGAAVSPYLVMELVDGPSLARVLAAGPLAPARAMDVLAQAAAGLQAAHAAGLVHRDVKPGNLLVGRSGQVKITDFGIAHAAWSAPLTQTGALVGTPAYLAPERVTGGPATPASDLYSLGVVGYQCLTGAAPFDGVPPVTAAHQHRTLPPLPAAVPAEVAELVRDLTARDRRPGRPARVRSRCGPLCCGMPWPGAQPRPGQPARRVARPPARATGAEPAALAEDPVTLAGDRSRWPASRSSSPGSRTRGWRQPAAGRGGRGCGPGRGGCSPGGAWRWLWPAWWSWRAWRDGCWRAPSGPGRGRPSRGPRSPPRAHRAAVGAAHRPGGRHRRGERRCAGRAAGQCGEPATAPDGPAAPRRGAVRGGQAPGTVISVQPSGRVPAGSTVTVTAALPPPGQGNGNGNGQGNNDD